MTIKDAEKFYSNDKKEYILTNRPGFENWFNKNYGTDNYLTIEDLQELVDKVITWYIFRYPNRLLNDSELDNRFNKIKDISDEMVLRQLLYRLSESELSLFEAKYRTNSGYCHDNKYYCGIRISKGNKSIVDFFITQNGNLSFDTQRNYKLPFQSIEEFYEQNKDSVYDMTNVLKCIELHNNDLILRNHIVDAIRKGLLYYTRTTPEYGKYRMDKFTSDIMSNYEDIDLENKKYIIEENKTTKDKRLLKRIRGDKK